MCVLGKGKEVRYFYYETEGGWLAGWHRWAAESGELRMFMFRCHQVRLPMQRGTHQALTVHALVAVFQTLLHIVGQMVWRWVAQTPKAYSVTSREGEDF